jgi:hypothetical protein
MQIRFLEHLIQYTVFTKEQHGHRIKLTMKNATYKLTNEILNAVNNILIWRAISCDLEKI